MSTTIPQTTTRLATTTSAPPTTSPCGMAFDPLGNIYVSYPLSNKIYKQNQLYFPITPAIELNTPMGLCYMNNTLYIADWGNSRIVGYNGTTSTTISIPNNIKPYGLCVTPAGIYICGQDSIYRFTPPSTTAATLVKQNSGSDFMFMCADGNILYICDSTSKSVRQYNTQTNNFVV
jgi:DNA-binding beta-propeller fold protein YncE